MLSKAGPDTHARRDRRRMAASGTNAYTRSGHRLGVCRNPSAMPGRAHAGGCPRGGKSRRCPGTSRACPTSGRPPRTPPGAGGSPKTPRCRRTTTPRRSCRAHCRGGARTPGRARRSCGAPCVVVEVAGRRSCAGRRRATVHGRGVPDGIAAAHWDRRTLWDRCGPPRTGPHGNPQRIKAKPPNAWDQSPIGYTMRPGWHDGICQGPT